MSRRRLLRVGLTVAVLGLVVFFFGRALVANWDAVREIEVQVNAWSVGAVVLFGAAVIVSGLLWGSMVTHLGTTRVTAADAIRVQCASWLLKYVPGQVGSVANKVLWAQQRGISRTLVVITFVYENVFLLLGSIIPTAVILLLHDVLVGDSADVVGMLLPVLLALVPLLLVTNRRVFRWGVNLVARRALKRDVPEEYFLGGRASIGYQLAFLLPRLVNGLGFVLIVASFLDVPSTAYLPLAATYVLAGAVGILAVFVPSGLGVRESVIVLLASRYMPVEQAIVLSLLARLYSTVGDVVVALVYGALKIRDVREGSAS
ncbi:flippase-like domain-containing protein [Actinotalea sp. BY-33]|uniref:Flippase-like domain-containing protein n=1 Tax=Actinotalea soli TaxID=2819234 RepID=A0A939RTD3_9CELL|nr:lysylphosphatidylglycerol synthase domain-containing protein [Actinotalea soli]MBO1750954.1 flippase-like domain-containing protein [Actinotalea soli]